MPTPHAQARHRSPAIRSAIPPAFLARMAGLLGTEYAAFAATFADPPRSGLRLNTLKVSSAEFARLASFALEPLPWPPAAYLIADETQPGKHPFHAAGLYYLQDPAAMAPAALLDPQPGERILDLSAAPGGKATHLASLLAGRGLLVANEVHSQRAWDLAENLERWGVTNAVILNETPQRLAATWPDFFDRVLVDAPCSGEGMLRKSEAARREWAPQLIEGCALRQAGILESAARLVRPGGVLAYATCTFAPEENEGTVARFLAGHPAFELQAPEHRPGFASGRPDWLSGTGAQPDLAVAVRLWPQHFPGEGQFVALLRRKDEREGAGEAAAGDGRRSRQGLRRGGSKSQPGAGQATEVPRVLRDQYLDFCRETLVEAELPGEQDLALAGTYLYRRPAGMPDPAGLRAIHPGWWLGSFKKDRFEPSHALALALTAPAARRSVDLDPEDEALHAYLRGEAIRQEGEDGWTLVTVAGYPLGWAKRVHGVLKSHYPRGLRRY
ncbi:MAG TPA: RsmF rRNA methyltransferase first C-terminal domain-containing protein [Anaerolineae bacterium]